MLIGGLGDALVDCSGDPSARTWTDLTLHKGGRYRDPAGTVTVTNKITRGSNVSEIAAV
jgi:hypothetical protein